MVNPEVLFILIVILGLFGLFGWAFRVLPKEEWQFLAVIPFKQSETQWRGINLTYYGVFSACGVCFAVMILVLLLGSIGKSLPQMLSVLIPLLVLTVPAAKLMAKRVERKSSTLTIGGASFIGMLAAPCVVWAVNRLSFSWDVTPMPMAPTLAAMWIAFAFGEGIGRLACISFGCCYGKPLGDCSPLLKWIFGPTAFRFMGKTKKAVYAGRLEGVPLVPIQGLTAIINSVLGVFGTMVFMKGEYELALVTVALGTQGWRIVSELFRTDHRGKGLISPYQWMALIGALYSVLLVGLWKGAGYPPPQIMEGVQALWDIQVMMALQVLWLVIFFFTGVSRVTKASISTEVCYEHV